ncbi:MAG: PKD domain-containing protein [bacterium]|nr:PKD domain-containing protein [bacterium]
MLRIRYGALAVTIVLALVALACSESATAPAAPSGTTLSIVANPTSINLDGTSALTVTAIDSSGVPARVGTEINFTTTLGRVDPAVATTDEGGFARATLTADGRTGQAQVRAFSGTVSAQTSVSIQQSRPSANFSFQANGLRVIFNDSSSGDPTQWVWDFGDGRTSAEQNPVHEYAEADTYVVSLTVTNAAGQDTTSQFVTVF